MPSLAHSDRMTVAYRFSRPTGQERGGARTSTAEQYCAGARPRTSRIKDAADTERMDQLRRGKESSVAVLDVMERMLLSLPSSSKNPSIHTGSGGLACANGVTAA